MSSLAKAVNLDISCVSAGAANQGMLMPHGFDIEGSLLPQPLEDCFNAISNTASAIISIPSKVFPSSKQVDGEKTDASRM